MSNLVFPSLPGLEWGVSRTELAPPVQVRTTPSQREFRARDAVYPRYQYSLSYEFLRSGSQLEWQTLLGFFHQHGGDFDSFLFTDPDDSVASATQFGVGDGSTTAYQLVRTQGGFGEPISAINGMPAVFMGATALNAVPNGDFDADTDANGLSDGWASYAVGTVGTTSWFRNASGTGSANAQVAQASGLGTTPADQIGIECTSRMYAYAGQPIAFAADIRDSGLTTRLHIDWYSQTDAYISSSTANFSTSASYVRRTLLATAPAGVSYGRAYIWGEARSAGVGLGFIEVDRVQIQSGSAATTFSARYFTVTAGSGAISILPAPTAAALLTWSGGFNRRVRFLRGQLETRKFMQDYWEAKKVELLSLKAGSQ